MVSLKSFMHPHTTSHHTHSNFQAVSWSQNPPPPHHGTTCLMTFSSPFLLLIGPSLLTMTIYTAHFKLFSISSSPPTFGKFTKLSPAYTMKLPPSTGHASMRYSGFTLTHLKQRETKCLPSNYAPLILPGSENAKTSLPRTASPTPYRQH